MKKLTIIWTIVMVTIFGALIVYGFAYKKENLNSIMEDDLVNQTKKYMGLYPGLYPSVGKTKTITSDDLLGDNYKLELKSDCTGYVIVTNNNNMFKYKAYIKCPDYTSKGYQE